MPAKIVYPFEEIFATNLPQPFKNANINSTILFDLVYPSFSFTRGYVNKIKDRYAEQPEICRQFLESMSSYWKWVCQNNR